MAIFRLIEPEVNSNLNLPAWGFSMRFFFQVCQSDEEEEEEEKRLRMR